jgi:hypothetical protein
MLPRKANGQPNKRAIAMACHLHRNIFYKNPDVLATLNAYERAEGQQRLLQGLAR